MRKYWAIFRVGFLNSLVYRFDFLFWGLNELLSTLVFLFIWMVLFGERNAIGGFTLPETVTYLIGAGIIADILDTWIGNRLQRDIQSGRLSRALLKPMSYFLGRGMTISASSKPVNLAIRLGVYILIAISFKEKFIFNQDFFAWILLLVSIILAYLINTLIEFIFGCIAFWTTTTRGSGAVLGTVRRIFSGAYAPLTFFPPLLQSVASILPFAYTRYFPMLIYLNKLTTIEIIKGLLVQVFWIGALLFLTKKIWRKGLRRYEGVGI